MSFTELFFLGVQVFRRNRYMDVFAAFGVCLLYTDFLEIMDSHFEVSAQNLNVYDDLLVFGASERVPILFVV